MKNCKLNILLFFSCLIILIASLNKIYALGQTANINKTKTKISLWTFWSKDFFSDAISEFEKDNPEFYVDYQQLSWSNGKDKITTAIAGGAAPDIIELGSTWLPEFIGYNSLAELPVDLLADFVAGFDAAIMANKLYGLPLYGSINLVYYNKTLFQRAGIKDTPKNWQELLAAAEKIKALGKDFYGYAIKTAPKETAWQNFIGLFGLITAEILSADYKTVLLNSPQNRETFEFFNKLKTVSKIGTQYSVRQAFYKGEVGMIIDGPGFNLEKKAPKLDAGFFIMPAAKSKINKSINAARAVDKLSLSDSSYTAAGVGFTGVDYLSISVTCKHKQKAIELAKLLTEKNIIPKKVKMLLPFNKKSINNYLQSEPLAKFYIEQLQNSRTTPAIKDWENLMDKLATALELLARNEKNIDAVIDLTQKEMTAVISRPISSAPKIQMRLIIVILTAISILFIAWLLYKIKDKTSILFLSPWAIWFVSLSLYPVIYSFFIAFTNYNPLMPNDAEFVFLDNFKQILKDAYFWRAMKNTVVFSIVVIPASVILALITAVFLNEKLIFRNVFRAAYFFPVITSIIVIALIFNYLYATFGPINALLKTFGFNEIDFLNNPKYALYAVAIMSIWAGFGYFMLLFLAALQSIPEDLYESAAIDGANALQRFFYITLPQLKSMILFVSVICTIRTLQVFSEMFVMTGGGPLDATTTAVYYVYKQGFSKYQMGYASAAAYILFVIILIFSLIQMRIFKNDEK